MSITNNRETNYIKVMEPPSAEWDARWCERDLNVTYSIGQIELHR